MGINEDKIVKEILDKCKKKNIRVHYILKFNSGIYKEMDYFIAPPVEDVGGERIGCRNGYSYKSNSIFKRIKKDSLGSGIILGMMVNLWKFIEIKILIKTLVMEKR